MVEPLPLLSGLLLAGGAGRRLGGADKGLAVLYGRPLIEWGLAALAPQVDELFISANRHLDVYARYGHPVLTDRDPDYPGPLAGLLAGLTAARHDWLLVCPCDVPLLPADLAVQLWRATRAAGTGLAVAADDERLHPAILLIHNGHHAAVERYYQAGGRSLHGLLAQLPHARAGFDAELLANLNQPEDFTPLSR
jgi:molybdopterin-guanine dinucleotide biosynthesis protein A